MTDQNSQFFAILTALGEAKQANANALGVPWTFSQMGVGDANNTDPVPSRTQTKLINERRRAPLNQIKVDPANASIIIAEQVIPPDVGGWWIREIGLYDAAGDLVAVANCAPTFKPLLTQGTGKTQVVRLNIVVTSTANVELKIDPAVVLATRTYVDTSILAALPANKMAGTYTQVQIDVCGVVQQGFNPTTLAGYGITDAIKRGEAGLAASSAPSAAIDTVGLAGGFYYFGSGQTSFANYISLLNVPYGNNRFAAQVGFTQGTAEPVMFIRNCSAENTFGPTRRVWHSGDFDPANKADKANSLAGYGINNAYTKIEVDNALSGKAAKATTLAGYGINDTYTKTEVDNALSGKAAKATTLAGYGINDTYTKTEVDNALSGKAAKATTLAGYGITDALRVNVVSQQQPTLAAPSAGSAAANSAAVVREAQEVGATQSADEYAPAIGFYWLNRNAGRLIMDALGVLKWNGKPLLTGTVATQAETDAGSSDTAVVTPRKIRFGFAASFTENGYLILPSWLGGFVFQWGQTPAAPVAGSQRSFVIPFPNKCLCIVGSPFGNLSSQFEGAEFYNLTATTFYSANSANQTNSYFAIGH